MTRIVFYDAVDDRSLFETVGYYRNDLEALRLDGDDVISTNSVLEVLRARPDLMVGWFFKRAVVPAALVRLFGGKVVLTGVADYLTSGLTTGWRLGMMRISTLASAVIANRLLVHCSVDYEAMQALLRRWPRLARKVQRANLVVQTHPPGRHGYQSQDGLHAYTICWMGTVANVRRKGVDKAIEVIAAARNSGLDATLVIAGAPGPGTEYLRGLVAERHLTECVKFWGLISEAEKAQLVASGRCYLQLSSSEGFGLAAAEAFLSGVIVVHTNVGGLGDVIGERGIVVSPSEVDLSDPRWVRNLIERMASFQPLTQSEREELLNSYSLAGRAKVLKSVLPDVGRPSHAADCH